MNIENIKYAIFDLDGTLFNSIDDYKKLWVNFWKKFGIPQKLAEKLYFWLQKLHGAKPHTFSHTIGIFGLWSKIIIWKLMNFGNQTPKLFPGVEELLQKLRQKGIVIFASSGALETEKRLKKAGIAKYFKKAYGKEQGTKGRHIQKFAQELNIAISHFCHSTVSIGDIPNDMKEAVKYGIRAIATTNGAITYAKEELADAGATVVLDKIEDLIDLI